MKKTDSKKKGNHLKDDKLQGKTREELQRMNKKFKHNKNRNRTIEE